MVLNFQKKVYQNGEFTDFDEEFEEQAYVNLLEGCEDLTTGHFLLIRQESEIYVLRGKGVKNQFAIQYPGVYSSEFMPRKMLGSYILMLLPLHFISFNKFGRNQSGFVTPYLSEYICTYIFVIYIYIYIPKGRVSGWERLKKTKCSILLLTYSLYSVPSCDVSLSGTELQLSYLTILIII